MGNRQECAVAYPLRASGWGGRGFFGEAPSTWLQARDLSGPEVFVLLCATDSMVLCFGSQGAMQQAVERETPEDYEKRSWPA